MISDRCAEKIARTLLEPHGMSDDVIASAAELIKTLVQLDDCEKRMTLCDAKIATHSFLSDTFKQLRDRDE